MTEAYRSQFRLPYPLYEKLRDAAERAGRSLNSELVVRLENSLAGPALPSNESITNLTRAMIDMRLVSAKHTLTMLEARHDDVSRRLVATPRDDAMRQTLAAQEAEIRAEIRKARTELDAAYAACVAQDDADLAEHDARFRVAS